MPVFFFNYLKHSLYVFLHAIWIRYSSAKPSYEFLPVEGGYQCKLTLPSNSALQTIIGPSGKDIRLARHLVCFEACKKLHQMGALNEHLVPFIEILSEDDHVVKNKESSSGAGIIISYFFYKLWLNIYFNLNLWLCC